MTASDDVTDSLEADELLEDDGPIFPACGRLTFRRDHSERELEVDEEKSSRGSAASSQAGSFSLEQNEGTRQHTEGMHTDNSFWYSGELVTGSGVIYRV